MNRVQFGKFCFSSWCWVWNHLERLSTNTWSKYHTFLSFSHCFVLSLSNNGNINLKHLHPRLKLIPYFIKKDLSFTPHALWPLSSTFQGISSHNCHIPSDNLMVFQWIAMPLMEYAATCILPLFFSCLFTFAFSN